MLDINFHLEGGKFKFREARQIVRPNDVNIEVWHFLCLEFFRDEGTFTGEAKISRFFTF